MSDYSAPVFIDQMPDYQQAAQTIREAALKNHASLLPAVQELRLAKEYDQMQAGLQALKPQLDGLHEHEKVVESLAQDNKNYAQYRARNASFIGTGVAAASGVTGGILGAKRFGKLWGVVTGAMTALATKLIAAFTAKAVLDRPTEGTTAQIQQTVAGNVMREEIGRQYDAATEPFVAAMATRMLEERKEFLEKDGKLELVSNAVPSTTHTEALARQAQSAAIAR